MFVNLCPSCGREIGLASMCFNCGFNVPLAKPKPDPESPTTTPSSDTGADAPTETSETKREPE